MGGWTYFDTAIGPCGLAWGEQGIVGSQLPERDEQALLRRMQRRFALLPRIMATDEMPADAVEAMRGVQAMLRGEPVDLSAVPLDLRGIADFHQRAYALARQLQPGQTTTYGELARQLGDPGLARAVGQAMGQNRFAPIVPCHRVLAADGSAGGFSAVGGAHTKLRLLAIERAAPNGQPSLF